MKEQKKIDHSEFVEHNELPLICIFIFENISNHKLKNMPAKIEGKLTKQRILHDGDLYKEVKEEEKAVVLGLKVTNIDFSNIQRIYHEAKTLNGFSELTLSSIKFDDIIRYNTN